MAKPVNFLIFLGFLLNMNLLFALSNISVNYPNNVNAGQEFNITVNLNNFTTDSYDVKIELIDKADNITTISKIWDGLAWQTSYRYVLDAINTTITNQGSFKINITSIGNKTANIQVRLRNSLNKIYTFSGYSINVIDNRIILINNTNTTNNQSQINNTNPAGNTIPKINLSISWDEDEIINGEEFDIKIKAYNLEDKNYDIKVYIYDNDKNMPISQNYYEDKWMSSSLYLNEFFNENGNISDEVRLRIRESDRDFSGNAYIGVKIRENNGYKIFNEINEKIKIKKAKAVENNNEENPVLVEDSLEINDNSEEDSIETIEETPITGSVIKLSGIKAKTENIKRQKNVVYESKNQKIIKYSIYGFIALLVIFIILIMLNKLK